MFKIIGGVVGFFMGSFLGLFGMIIGAVIGSSLGRSVDSLVFGTKNNSYTNQNSQNAQDAYRKFYEQFYQNSGNTSYANNGRYDYNSVNTGASDSHYADIGCIRTDSNDVIKKRYRKMVSEFHPDRIAGKGLSDRDVIAAETKFKKIQESYNLIKKEKGL